MSLTFGKGLSGRTMAAGGPAAPTVSSVSPTHADALVATAITVNGADFVSGVGLAVTINAVACTSVTWVSSGQITCTTPASAAGGPYDVTVTNPDTQTGTLVAGYTFDTPAFDPASLTLSGWWRANFASSPWTSTASAGASSGRTLSEATNPPAVGTAVNGYDPADFNGTNDELNTTVVESDLFTAAAGSAIALYYADTAVAAQGGATADDGIFQGVGAYFAIGVNSTGPIVRVYEATAKEIQLTKATGSWTAVQMKWNGTTLYARKDSDGWSSIACGNMGDLSSALRCGENCAGTEFFDGRILEIITAPSTLSDGNFDSIVSYFNSRYGLAL